MAIGGFGSDSGLSIAAYFSIVRAEQSFLNKLKDVTLKIRN
jgi:hypothetical protein